MLLLVAAAVLAVIGSGEAVVRAVSHKVNTLPSDRDSRRDLRDPV
ncbi:hypothetical protein [Mycobacterium sp.]